MPLKLQILSTKGIKWLGFAKNRLALLTRMRLKALGQGKKRIFKKTYALPDNVRVQVIAASPNDIIRIWGGTVPTGFICYPRSSVPVEKTIVLDNIPRSYLAVDGPGFDDENTILVGAPELAYPINQLLPNTEDGPWGSKAFLPEGSQWQYEPNTDPMYGNVDWKGPIGDGDDRKVLTWVGPPSRYFAQNPLICAAIGFVPFSNSVYESGAILATLPDATQTDDMGEAIPYIVLGTAIMGGWLIVACRWYKMVLGENGSVSYLNKFNIMAAPYDSAPEGYYHPIDNPGGWRVLPDSNPSTVDTIFWSPLFFNASGTECCTVLSGAVYLFTISTAVDSSGETHFAVAVTLGDSVLGNTVTVGASNTSSSGQDGMTKTYAPPYGDYASSTTLSGTYIEESATRVIAADWKEDELVTATVQFQSNTAGDSASVTTVTKTEINEVCTYTTGYTYDETQHTGDIGNGSYDWKLLLSGGQEFSLGTGTVYEALITDANEAQGETFSTLDEAVFSISGPSTAAIGSTYVMAGIAPYTYSISCGSINSSTGVVTAIGSCACGTLAVVTGTDACGHTATKNTFMYATGGTWVEVSCSSMPNSTMNDYCTGGVQGTYVDTDGVRVYEWWVSTSYAVVSPCPYYCFTAGLGCLNCQDLSTWGPRRNDTLTDTHDYICSPESHADCDGNYPNPQGYVTLAHYSCQELRYTSTWVWTC